jgi:protein gp37
MTTFEAMEYMRSTDVPDRLPFPAQYDVPFAVVQSLPARLGQPSRWKAPERIFVNSVSDLFHEDVSDGFIDQVFAVMALANWHTFIVLTKRPERMREYLTGVVDGLHRKWWVLAEIEALESDPDTLAQLRWPLPNLHLCVSAENQAKWDERVPILLNTPAAVHGVSCEPLLGDIDPTGVQPFRAGWYGARGMDFEAAAGILGGRVDWVIVGGESGTGFREMQPEWAISLRQHCLDGGVALWEKQWSGRRTELPYPPEYQPMIRQLPGEAVTP